MTIVVAEPTEILGLPGVLPIKRPFLDVPWISTNRALAGRSVRWHTNKRIQRLSTDSAHQRPNHPTNDLTTADLTRMEHHMKTTIATALSVIGVLGAGSAAALVNTQILDGGPAESTASAAVLPPASTVDVSIPELLEARVPELQVDTTVDTTTPTTQPEAPKPAAPAAPAPSGYLTSFNVGEAGVVTVDVVDGQLLLVDTEAKAGWQVSKAEQHDDDNEVEVYFSSSTVRVEFEAALIDGQIVPKVSSKSLGTSAAPAKAAPTTRRSTRTRHRYDAGHEHDDDEHDDDETTTTSTKTTSTTTTSTTTTSTTTTSTKTTSTKTRIATMTDVTRGPASGTAGAAESAPVDRTQWHRDGDRCASNSDRRCSDLRPTRPADRCHIRQPSAGSGRGGGPPAPIAGDDRQDRHRRRLDDCGARHDGRVRHRRPGGRQQTGAVAARRNRLARTGSGVVVARNRAAGRQYSHVDRAATGDRRRDRWRHRPAGCRRLRPVDVGSDAPRRCRRDPGRQRRRVCCDPGHRTSSRRCPHTGSGSRAGTRRRTCGGRLGGAGATTSSSRARSAGASTCCSRSCSTTARSGTPATGDQRWELTR